LPDRVCPACGDDNRRRIVGWSTRWRIAWRVGCAVLPVFVLLQILRRQPLRSQ
jgi:hypothetical protein